jgi:4-hydroxy-tetrahydrodipicolinate synthase
MTAMDLVKLRECLKTVVVVNTTPFTAEGSAIDFGALRRNVRFLADNGITALVPCGGTGEFYSLSLEEHKAVTRMVVGEVGDRCVVLPGVGYSTKIVVELGLAAQQAGAHGVMLMPPAHNFISEDGIEKYYSQIINALSIGVMIYHRGIGLTDEILARLIAHERVVAVKYATNDLAAFGDLVHQTLGAEVTWLCGTAERWAPFFAVAGAEGFSSGMANFAPRLALELQALLKAGEFEKAFHLRAEKFASFERLRARHNNNNNVPAVKYAMDLLGLYGGPCREPIHPLNELDSEECKRLVRSVGLKGAVQDDSSKATFPP